MTAAVNEYTQVDTSHREQQVVWQHPEPLADIERGQECREACEYQALVITPASFIVQRPCIRDDRVVAGTVAGRPRGCRTC